MNDNLKENSERVLVVDDDQMTRMMISTAVRALGYEVDTADGGSNALELLQHDSFDAVLLDIVMPEVDGFDVLKSLKSDPRLRDIPVIVISGLDSEMDSVVKAIELAPRISFPNLSNEFY